jgi:hypothetical protein
MNECDQIVMVPVRNCRLDEVYKLLASESTTVLDSTTSGLLGPNAWDEDSLRVMFKDSTQDQRTFLVELANRGARGLTTDEVKQLIKGLNSVPGFLGAFGRRCANRYGRERPFTNQYSDQTGSLYVMADPIAAMIKKIAAE